MKFRIWIPIWQVQNFGPVARVRIPNTLAEMCYPWQFEISFRNISFNDPVGSWTNNHTKIWTSSYILNETHYYDNGKKLIIGPEMKKFFNTALSYTRRMAYTSLRKGFKLATESGTIISSKLTGSNAPWFQDRPALFLKSLVVPGLLSWEGVEWTFE